MAVNNVVCNECHHQDAFSRNGCELNIKLGQALGCERFKRSGPVNPPREAQPTRQEARP